MTLSHRGRARAVVLLLVLVGASLPGDVRAQETPAKPGEPVRQPEAAAATADMSPEELEALFWARKDSARMQFTDADVEFMTGMISHHAQAIVMSELAPSHGAGSAVQTLAARIINSQRDEIARMQRWLELRGQPVPQVSEHGHMEGMRHAEASEAGAHSMPGMLTAEQLEELRSAFGVDFDRLFLTYMIQHHGGAIVMVNDLLAQDGAAQDRAAFKLASDIQVDQTTEIERMHGLLDQMHESTDAREGTR